MSYESPSWSESIDRAGVIASAGCFVHCLATPVLLSFSAVWAHFLPFEEITHRILAVAVTLLGALALIAGYRRHRRRSIFVVMALGLTLIFTGAWFGGHLPSHWHEVAITTAGSCCMICAHRMNHTFCRRCTKCC